ncbi:hypothetical protein K491DRAFT_711481 [Lophiostoma macrostomum CBS 122681]|uniref:F-box domain-containing protein n=1 Tax=Lophiostoma macrostomum CBS 122681 TaxID=1314788 RepID=A0A6A6TN68_9PLEO|nr:hypothetical protein K491DRAFT_711481 [Lophiostoma macrostomum CBS 122681]
MFIRWDQFYPDAYEASWLSHHDPRPKSNHGKIADWRSKLSSWLKDPLDFTTHNLLAFQQSMQSTIRQSLTALPNLQKITIVQRLDFHPLWAIKPSDFYKTYPPEAFHAILDIAHSLPLNIELAIILQSKKPALNPRRLHMPPLPPSPGAHTLSLDRPGDAVEGFLTAPILHARLTELVLHGAFHSADRQDILAFVSECPLKVLRLHSISLVGDGRGLSLATPNISFPQLRDLSISDTVLDASFAQFFRHHISTLRSVSLVNVHSGGVAWWFFFHMLNHPEEGCIEVLRLERCTVDVAVDYVPREDAVERAVWTGNGVIRAKLEDVVRWLCVQQCARSGQGQIHPVVMDLCDAGDWVEEEPWFVWP